MIATAAVVPPRTATAGPATVTLQLAVPVEVADAVCRLVDQLHAAGEPPGRPAPLDAPLSIYPDRRIAVLDGVVMELTRLEFALLAFLAEHPERVFDRRQLLSLVWGYDAIAGSRTIDVHVRRLRAKLGTRSELIGTVRGVGYKLSRRDWIQVLHDPA